MDDIRKADVVVVGAGPTGLAVAVGLRQHGVDVAVVEKAALGKREARAGIIWQRALEVLADLGCAREMTAEGIKLRRVEVFAEGRRAWRMGMECAGTAFPNPLSIEQDAVERLLGERLVALGGRVEWSTEAVAVRTGGDGAEVDVRTGDGGLTTLRCAWVIGCEGAHSVVRKGLGIPFEGGRRPDLQCVQLNAVPDWKVPYRPGHTYFFLERGLSMGVSPRPGGGYRFFAFLTDPDPTVEGPPGVEEMRDLVARSAHEPGVRLAPTDPPWANRARFQDRVAATLREGRALLAGDSAHLWAPIGGHGLNTGLRGAHNLAWKVAAAVRGWAADPFALLDTYSTEQRLTAEKVMREMRHNLLELPPTALALRGMRLVGGPVMSTPWASGRIRSMLSDLTMHHRESALSQGGGGDRLPDPFVRVRGRHCRLHDLLSYQRWTLLAAPGAKGPGMTDDHLRALVAGYRAPVDILRPRTDPDTVPRLPGKALVLVRPDRHIGLRTDRVEELEAYLRRWFARDAV
ncbi:FAD-dependent oxidoreductase [Streptomyces cinnamoneus]|uniref:FAD-dependent oxidoreductase n=1 Tax=Streptomyces cinnamoneus TaxID=53446 RepID=UPI0015E39472|nr:FAD-dependent oxidoreductase [Streptomyces cinnamoneus]